MCRMGSMLLAKLEVENYGKFGKTYVVQLFNRKRPHHILPYMASIKETSPSRRVAQMACCHFDSLERRSWKKRAQQENPRVPSIPLPLMKRVRASFSLYLARANKCPCACTEGRHIHTHTATMNFSSHTDSCRDCLHQKDNVNELYRI